MPTTIFEGAQTYLGVLATFIVLCLFISKSENDSNFIIYTLIKVREEYIEHLAKFVNEIRREIRTNEEKDLKEGLPVINSRTMDPDKRLKLITNRRNTMMVTQQFFNKVSGLPNNFAPDLKHKEELPYIALLSLCLIIAVMMIDCLGCFSVSSRCSFINMLLFVSSFFSLVLYRKFFGYTDSVKTSDTPPSGKRHSTIVVCIFILIQTLWLFLSPFIDLPWLAIGTLAIIQLLAGYSMKSKWIEECHKVKGYSRSIVIKHYVLFVSYILVISILMAYWEDLLRFMNYSEQSISRWEGIYAIISSCVICYYYSIIFFTINSVLGPITAGYVYLQLMESRLIKNIREQQKEFQPLIADLSLEFKKLLINR